MLSLSHSKGAHGMICVTCHRLMVHHIDDTYVCLECEARVKNTDDLQ
jgi:DNA-directed RNA polymerase subunit RPC12/RpoP